MKREPIISPHASSSQTDYSIAFEANLEGHCYVLLENSKVLTPAELIIFCNFSQVMIG